MIERSEQIERENVFEPLLTPKQVADWLNIGSKGTENRVKAHAFESEEHRKKGRREAVAGELSNPVQKNFGILGTRNAL